MKPFVSGQRRRSTQPPSYHATDNITPSVQYNSIIPAPYTGFQSGWATVIRVPIQIPAGLLPTFRRAVVARHYSSITRVKCSNAYIKRMVFEVPVHTYVHHKERLIYQQQDTSSFHSHYLLNSSVSHQSDTQRPLIEGTWQLNQSNKQKNKSLEMRLSGFMPDKRESGYSKICETDMSTRIWDSSRVFIFYRLSSSRFRQRVEAR